MTMTAETRVKTEDEITDEVRRRFDVTSDARLREVMQSLVKHLHAFAREVQLTDKEWFAGIEFLTAVGKKCTGNRQEFILLSDTLGLSILVDKINRQFPGSATETTVLGPFYRPGAEELPPGGNMATIDRAGTPLLIPAASSTPSANQSRAPFSTAGRPLPKGSTTLRWAMAKNSGCGACTAPMRTAATWCGRHDPKWYPVPTDGPVGDMLRATDRHPYRPGHVHFMITAPGYQPLVTHIFDKSGEYLDSDTVFAVKDSLKVDFVERSSQEELAHVPASPHRTSPRSSTSS